MKKIRDKIKLKTKTTYKKFIKQNLKTIYKLPFQIWIFRFLVQSRNYYHILLYLFK